MILLVEDSIRFYSSVLPNLYSYILVQSKRFSTEALNPHTAAQRKRGRPKVVLARTYEEAISIYEKYADNTIGVISDVRFPREGKKDPEAGFRLLREIGAEPRACPGRGFPLCRQELEEDEYRPAQSVGRAHGVRRLHLP